MGATASIPSQAFKQASASEVGEMVGKIGKVIKISATEFKIE